MASTTFKSQQINDNIATWITLNKMKLNEDKSKNMVTPKSKERFSTRITINEEKKHLIEHKT